MNKKQFDKLYNSVNEKEAMHFNKLATYIVDNQCKNLDGTPIIGEARNNLIWTMRYDVAYGSAYTKNRYIAFGVIGGIAVCGLSIIAYNKFIKKKKSES